VSSTLACVGLAVKNQDELQSLLERIGPRAQELGRVGRLRVLRWQDPSGARLVLGVTDADVPDLLPSFAGSIHARLADLRMVNDDVVVAAVVDETGEQLTSAAFEVEQRRLLLGQTVGQASAAIAALGVEVEVFDSTASFEESDASLLGGESSESEPPAEYVEKGWKWPPRVAANSFFSHGVFSEGDAATAHARLSGVVRSSERRIVAETGQEFVVAVVETVGFEVTVCLEGSAHLDPIVGGVISGTVFLVASLDDVPAPRASRWSLRRRR
jgi:hypothetical protein